MAKKGGVPQKKTGQTHIVLLLVLLKDRDHDLGSAVSKNKRKREISL